MHKPEKNAAEYKPSQLVSSSPSPGSTHFSVVSSHTQSWSVAWKCPASSSGNSTKKSWKGLFRFSNSPQMLAIFQKNAKYRFLNDFLLCTSFILALAFWCSDKLFMISANPPKRSRFVTACCTFCTSQQLRQDIALVRAIEGSLARLAAFSPRN